MRKKGSGGDGRGGGWGGNLRPHWQEKMVVGEVVDSGDVSGC